MKLPISIIIPTFNEEQYLPKLLRSIEAQTVQPTEIIVVDAYSVDTTRKIANSYNCKVIDGGVPAKARNLGAKIASQPILLFLDADVILPKAFLEKTIKEMTNRNLDIASCYIAPISHLKIDSWLHTIANYYIKMTSQFHPHVPGFCIFVKKTLHDRIKGFDETLILAEDHDYVRRGQKVGEFAYLESYKIPVSVRRLAEEGRVNVALKYVAVELHLLFLGKVRKSFLSYKFGEHFK
jgi:glycosyltransferase involved in cell wall biosynthesis